jgi:hypothetical protein
VIYNFFQASFQIFFFSKQIRSLELQYKIECMIEAAKEALPGAVPAVAVEGTITPLPENH